MARLPFRESSQSLSKEGCGLTGEWGLLKTRVRECKWDVYEGVWDGICYNGLVCYGLVCYGRCMSASYGLPSHVSDLYGLPLPNHVSIACGQNFKMVPFCVCWCVSFVTVCVCRFWANMGVSVWPD